MIGQLPHLERKRELWTAYIESLPCDPSPWIDRSIRTVIRLFCVYFVSTLSTYMTIPSMMEGRKESNKLEQVQGGNKGVDARIRTLGHNTLVV